MVDNELVKVIDQCVKHEFVGFNDVRDINEAVDTFSDALQRIHAMLRAKNKENVRWVMNCYPNLSLCLTNLRSHPVVINDKYLFSLVIKCILWFYQPGGCTGVQIKANRWARKQIQSSVSQISPLDECRAKELLVEKLESWTIMNEKSLREFWLKNYKLRDLIDDENMRRRIDDNLLRLVKKSQHEEWSKKIVENMWENTHKNDVETKRILWMLHAPGLESDVISLLDNQNLDICDQLFSSCKLNPLLFERVICILFSIFRATNHHSKPIQLATRLTAETQLKFNDEKFCCQLDPSTWLLLTHPKHFGDPGSVLRTVSERVASSEQLAFLLAVHSDWLRFLLRSADADLVSTRIRLVHSPDCRHRVQCGRFFVPECPRCIALSLDSYSSIWREIFPAVNLDVLLDWWQQE